MTGSVNIPGAGQAGAGISIPADVVFPDPANPDSTNLTLLFESLLNYANQNWFAAASRFTISGNGNYGIAVNQLTPISDDYILVDGIILKENGTKSTSAITVTIGYNDADIPDGYSKQDLKALVYDYTIEKWTPAAFKLSDKNTVDINTDFISAYAVVVHKATALPAGGFTINSNNGFTSETGTGATFTVALTVQPTADVEISVTSSDSTEGSVFPQSLIFTTDNWNTPQTVTAQGLDDDIVDGDQFYYLVLAPVVSEDLNYSGLDPDDILITNTDNDVTAINNSSFALQI